MAKEQLRVRWARALICLVSVVGLVRQQATACPFCSAVSMTLSEEMKTASVAVLAKMVSKPELPAEDDAAAQSSLDATPLKFEIIEHLKGGELLAEMKEFEVIYFGQGEAGSTFLVMGADPPAIVWGTPLLLSEASVEYVRQLPKLAETGPERLKFFQDHLNSADDLLSRDAYDEFARAPYADVKGLKEHMDLAELRAGVMNKELPASRRRLFLTMLGVAGGPDDLSMLEQMLTSNDPQFKTTLDAMIACYLTLKGPEGLPLVEDQFFRRQDAEFTDTYAAIVALRFHGQEEKIVPKERLVQAFRLMLDRPNYADLVIPDLARWEDWESMGRLVTLFKEADDDSSWVRVPVVQFLRQCPLPEAKDHIAELEKLDPDAVKRANSFLPFAIANAPVPPAGGTGEATPADAAVPTDPFTAAGENVEQQLSQGNGAEPQAPAAAAEPSAGAAPPAGEALATTPTTGDATGTETTETSAATELAATATVGETNESPPAAANGAEPETESKPLAAAPPPGAKPAAESAPSSAMIAAVVGGSLVILALLYLTMFGGRAAGSR